MSVRQPPAPPRSDWRSPKRLLDATLIFSALVLSALALYLALGRPGSPPPRAAQATPAIAEPDALALHRTAGQQWSNGERNAALATWERAYALAPEVPDINESLARARVGVAADHLRGNDPDGALPYLEAAYAQMPEEAAVVHELQALRAYLAGREAVRAGNWPQAQAELMPLFNLDAAYLDVRPLLERSMAAQQAAQSAERAAQDAALSNAAAMRPGQRVAALFNAPVFSNQPGQSAMPPGGLFTNSSDKHIVVSINAQRMYVYENGQLIYDWVASTGETERPTIPGRYRIQSQIEYARSNSWELWMPWWQGLYWAGSVENGIHGQVEFDSGGRLWEGYLGTRITFGCVMVSDPNAETLYRWADLGTPVSIHWDWNPAWTPDANGDPIEG
ncbi:MAG: L,D-transpeptidase family protein [Anaerolineales bacterium]|nr:L,D-transpeptidase family protein [Anaerolineales bacterium]